MVTQPLDAPIRVTVGSRSDMDILLDSAADRLRYAAQFYGDRGILVTRHCAQEFTLELHSSVPFGYTREQQRW